LRYKDKTCGAGHLEREKGMRSLIVELTPVVTLDGLDGKAELRGHVSDLARKGEVQE
jgi:hypothetical protein